MNYRDFGNAFSGSGTISLKELSGMMQTWRKDLTQLR